jgi:hypothetical protein
MDNVPDVAGVMLPVRVTDVPPPLFTWATVAAIVVHVPVPGTVEFVDHRKYPEATPAGKVPAATVAVAVRAIGLPVVPVGSAVM